MRRCVACLGFCSLIVTTSAQAKARVSETEPYYLRWSRDPGAESCIDAPTLSRQLAQVLGRPSAKTPEDVMLLEGRALRAEAPNQFQVQLRVLDARGELIGERVLSTQKAQCSALNSSLLLVLAMSVNPDAEYDGIPATVAEELPPDNDKDVQNPLETLPKQALSSVASVDMPANALASPRGKLQLTKRAFDLVASNRRRWSAYGGFALAAREVPKPTPGLVLGLRRTLPAAFSVSLSAAVWVPSPAHIEGSWGVPGGIDIGATHLRGVVCRGVAQHARFALHACAGGQVGFRWFSSEAFEREYRSTRRFYGPVVGLESTFPLNLSWRVRAAMNLAAQFPRDRFTYVTPTGQEQSLYTPALLAGDAFVGVEVTL